jgi:hypothetical protein
MYEYLPSGLSVSVRSINPSVFVGSMCVCGGGYDELDPWYSPTGEVCSGEVRRWRLRRSGPCSTSSATGDRVHAPWTCGFSVLYIQRFCLFHFATDVEHGLIAGS